DRQAAAGGVAGRGGCRGRGGGVRRAGGGGPAARRPEAGCTRASVARTAASDGRQLSAPEGRVPVVGFGHRKALVGVTPVAFEKVRFESNDDVNVLRCAARRQCGCGLLQAGATRRIAQIQLCRSTKSYLRISAGAWRTKKPMKR